ncbi:hypothetical protein BS17DRAFT_777720 [Gyrodon lividus]|nr:hypothetical protein BS17DRAFT_777720 [Gyrodon lividus]
MVRDGEEHSKPGDVYPKKPMLITDDDSDTDEGGFKVTCCNGDDTRRPRFSGRGKHDKNPQTPRTAQPGKHVNTTGIRQDAHSSQKRSGSKDNYTVVQQSKDTKKKN